MPEILNAEVVDSVANANFKTIGDQPAVISNIALQNAVTQSQNTNTIANNMMQGMNAILLALVGKIGETIVTIDPAEANGAAVLGQIGSKIAGNTPPQSNP